MKTTRSFSTRAFVRIVQLVAVASGLHLAAVSAAVPVVTVDLAGQEFGNGKEVHVNSGSNLLPAASGYKYRLEGTCHGTGALGAAVPNGTDIATLVDDIQSGGSSFLSGTYSNPGGSLPFTVINKTYNGNVSFQPSGFPFPINASASVTMKGKVNSIGKAKFDVVGVSLSVTGFTVTDTIVFEQGSHLVISVQPVIQLTALTQTIKENAGTINIQVKRALNSSGSVSVHYETAPGTADGSDYTPTSGTLTFADGETSKTVPVVITDKPGVTNGDRKFTFKLSSPMGGAILGLKKKETITITDAP